MFLIDFMFKERYENRKKEILADEKINEENRKIIEKFLIYEEKKLRRKQGKPDVDEKSYKTLYYYIGRFYKLNDWLKNKEWSQLKPTEIVKTKGKDKSGKEVITEKEILGDVAVLIDKLEDGVIKNKYGKRYADRSLYYQMLQGKVFEMVGVEQHAKDYFKELETKGRDDSEGVRFINEDTFRKIVDCAITPEQKCLMWLAFDIGENVGTLMELELADFKRSINKDTKEPEYLVILSKDKLKRSRTPRSEITNYRESVNFLDIVLPNVKPSTKKIGGQDKTLSEIHNENKLFKFGWKTAERFFKRAVNLANARCEPAGQRVTWKDLRSSMACDLLNKDWTTDEINARLGHAPSSRMIDKYVTYLSLDKKIPLKKVYESNLRKLEEELEKSKELGKLQGRRGEKQKEEIEELQAQIKEFEDFEKEARKTMETYPMEMIEKEMKKLEKSLSKNMKEALAKEREIKTTFQKSEKSNLPKNKK